MSEGTDFSRAGGEPVVRLVVERFVERVFADAIIGFYFEGKDRGQIAAREYEHAARALGADVPYTGRPIPELHQPLRINAGQFRRRLAILAQEIDRAGVPAEVRERWLASQRAMQALIVRGEDCGAP